MKNFSIEVIQQRRAELENAKKVLKSEFFGLDAIIDRVIDSIYAWYTFPDLIIRPVIVNLWGMTGVGKTQLVRRLVQTLNLSNIFVEVQMDGFSQGSSWNNKISDILESSSISEGEPGVLLLDEIQRYRTVGGKGEDVDIKRYQDIWMLLSDGKLSVDSSKFREIEDMFLNRAFNKDNPDNSDEDDETSSTPSEDEGQAKEERIRRFHIRPWQARQFKRLLKIPNSVEDIMSWSYEDVLEYAKIHQQSNSSHEIDYSKLLIFISGNLDEVYSTSGNTGDCDTDADIYHELSSKITTNEVKEALKRRFKPEQISRFGNNHVIYPSLNKDSYQKIIKTTCDKYVKRMEDITGLQFKLDEEILKEIYINSVYPTQGTRPVFSSIHKIFSGALTMISVWAIENGYDRIHLGIDVNKKVIIGSYLSPAGMAMSSTEVPVDLDIRSTKAMTSEDYLTMIAVHEAGHALMGMLLSNEAPSEINISLASWKGGYTFQKGRDVVTKQRLLDDMSLGLAGSIAEEIVFGEMNRSNGNVSDLQRATHMASEYIRSHSFGSVNAFTYLGDDPLCSTAVRETDNMVEQLVSEQKTVARSALLSNKDKLIKLVDALLINNKLNQKEIIDLFPDLSLTSDGSSPEYNKLWERYKNEN